MRRSFSLIEIIIYISLAVIILNIGVYFIWQVIESKMKVVAYQEVEKNINFVIEKISFEGKRAKSLGIPSFQGEETDELLLIKPNGQSVRFYLSDEKIVIDNNGQIIFLTTDKTEIKEMIFQNVSTAASGSFQVRLKIAYKNPEHRVEREASMVAQKTINLRDN